MRRDAAHRVEGDRATHDGVVHVAVDVGPHARQLDGFFERYVRDFGGNAANLFGGNATAIGYGVGCVMVAGVAVEYEREHSAHRFAICVTGPVQRGCYTLFHTTKRLRGLIEHQRFTLRVTHKQPVLRRPRCVDHQPRRVAVLHQIGVVDPVVLDEFVHDGQCKQPVGARTNWHPFVSNRAVSGAHRINRYELGAARFELVETDLDRVAAVIFCHTPQHKILRAIPVWRTEFPERIADGIQASRGHIHRAKATVCSPVGRAKLLRPKAG